MYAFEYRCCFFLYLATLHCFGLKYIDVEKQNVDDEKETNDDILDQYQLETGHKTKPLKKVKEGRRTWLPSNLNLRDLAKPIENVEEDKDEDLKTKISTLVEQTVHDTNKKVQSILHIKEQLRQNGPYKLGFILSMIKKTKQVQDELYNIATKHKDDWKALEQLKIFELIVHTNVDTTNLVRQLVEVHIQHMNTSSADHKSRVVLIK